MNARSLPMRLSILSLLPVPLLVLCLACTPTADAPSETADAADPQPTAPVAEWALAIHGGAGTIPKDTPDELRQQYVDALEAALSHGRDRLAADAPALEVVEEVVRLLEDAPQFNAGKGAVFNAAGENELDAAIMDGRDLSCGAVAGVRTVKNPITLARLVMTDTRHVLLMGDGAEAFADETGVERVEPDYYHTERRWEELQKRLEDDKYGTVGAVARDREGNLAAATSTGGLTAKKWGRVGDVPIIGAGTYADNRTVAVSCTGTGEEFIRHNAAHTVSALMAYEGLGVEEAASRVIHDVLQPGDGGLIAVAQDGSVALVFSSQGMFRGVADSNGRFEVAIWDEAYPGEEPAESASDPTSAEGEG